MEYYSVIKGNELSCTLRHGGNLNALLSEICQSEKATCCMIPMIKTFWQRQNYENSKLSGCQQLGRGERSENVEDRRILGQ